MRKKIIFLCFLACLFCVSAQTTDFSGKSLSELLKIQYDLTTAIWNSPEFKEAVVPEGIYEVGKDIPAGKWSVEIIGKPIMDSVQIYQSYTNGQLEGMLNWLSFTDSNRIINVNLHNGTYIRVSTKCKFKTFVPLF